MSIVEELETLYFFREQVDLLTSRQNQFRDVFERRDVAAINSCLTILAESYTRSLARWAAYDALQCLTRHYDPWELERLLHPIIFEERRRDVIDAIINGPIKNILSPITIERIFDENRAQWSDTDES